MSAPTADPLTGRTTVFAALTASTGKSQFGDLPRLIIRCREGSIDMYIDWDQFITTQSPTVDYRIGNGEVKSVVTNISTDYDATFFLGAYPYYIEEMLGQREFVARVTPHGSSPVTATFDITGIDNAVAPIYRACDL